MQAELNSRELRGQAIFEAKEQITRISGHEYEVLSQSSKGFYSVLATESGWICSCPDYMYRLAKCKHIFAVLFSLKFREQVEAQKIEQPSSTACCIFCGSYKLSKDGVRHNKNGDIQKFQCRLCKKYFTINLGFEKMKHNPQAIISAMQLCFSGESLRNVQNSVRLLGCMVSHQTVHNWIKKYIDLMHTYLDKIIPSVSEAWRADELWIKVKGNPKYLFALIDDETRFWLAEQIADKKGVSDVRPLFRQSMELVERKPNVLVTDGAPNFIRAFKKEYGTKFPMEQSVHMRHIHLKGDLNNNKMERFNGELRDREKTMRSLKKEDSPIIEGMRIYHNFIRPHMGLDGKTPAEASGIEVEGDNKWLTIIQNAAKPTKVYMKNNRGVPM